MWPVYSATHRYGIPRALRQATDDAIQVTCRQESFLSGRAERDCCLTDDAIQVTCRQESFLSGRAERDCCLTDPAHHRRIVDRLYIGDL